MVPHLPLTMGHELAGTVEAAGPGADGAPGGRVSVHPRVVRGATWPGDPGLGGPAMALGLICDGGFARYLRIEAGNALPLPEGIDAESEP